MASKPLIIVQEEGRSQRVYSFAGVTLDQGENIRKKIFLINNVGRAQVDQRGGRTRATVRVIDHSKWAEVDKLVLDIVRAHLANDVQVRRQRPKAA